MKLLSLIFFVSVSVNAGTLPDGYLSMTAHEKQRWHADEAKRTQYRPNIVVTSCQQSVALAGFGVKKFLDKTMSGGSGFADGVWRKLFDKPIHSVGVTTSGFLYLDQPFLDFPVAPIPVTIRYSEANPHLPYLPMAEHRPGLLVIFHRDGKKDRNLFLMPPDGLKGFSRRVNPFAITYTNWLNKPGLLLRTAAKLTFERVVSDPYTQYIESDLDENFPYGAPGNPSRATGTRLELQSDLTWMQRYDRTRGWTFWERLMEMGKFELSPMFTLLRDTGESGTPGRIGTLYIDGQWRPSRHGDTWYAEHKGFILQRNHATASH